MYIIMNVPSLEHLYGVIPSHAAIGRAASDQHDLCPFRLGASSGGGGCGRSGSCGSILGDGITDRKTTLRLVR